MRITHEPITIADLWRMHQIADPLREQHYNLLGLSSYCNGHHQSICARPATAESPLSWILYDNLHPTVCRELQNDFQITPTVLIFLRMH